MDCDVRFVMELLRPTGETIDEVPIDPDWEPAVEWTRLAGLRARGIWAAEAAAERRIEPLWKAPEGPPCVRGFRVHFEPAGAAAWQEDFPVTYFRGEAHAAGARLVARGALQAGESFLYRLSAFRRRAAPAAPAESALVAEGCPPPLALLETDITSFLRNSAVAHVGGADTFPVFLPHTVIEEATALTLAAGDREAGGLLIGHLHRRPQRTPADGPDGFFVEVTALLPAQHTVAHATRLTFTSETWTDVRATIALRARDEQLLGWQHSHPQVAWCAAKGCPPAAQVTCPRPVPFFSQEDCLLHRTMFPRAYTIALLVTHTIQGCVPSMFGWHRGVVAERGFRVTGAPPDTAVRLLTGGVPAGTQRQGACHAPSIEC